jgi:hypothetical protein
MKKANVLIYIWSKPKDLALGITGCLDFIHRPVFQNLENTTFRKLELLPASGEGRDAYSVGSLRKS